mmetsp:Transcript_32811/g.74999  ORF Transcript_32811/g.74999 Transcript_32811/m.74999 type:complete len:279 (-) Transcript_32811:492-1328(-)
MGGKSSKAKKSKAGTAGAGGGGGGRGGSPTFAPILDRFETLEEAQKALRTAGLESSNLIIGIDFTKSNTWTGEKSFGGKCLHDTTVWNPYQSVLTILGKTLAVFDDDNLIPVFGFGDAYTQDRSCFPFFPDRPCHGFEEALQRYNQVTPGIQLAGPTNFAPVIRAAIQIVQQERGYHILVIIADGQVTAYDDTVNAIVEASSYPLSIVCVGVGDGPWDMMQEFDDKLPARKFDNFQFVEYNDVFKRYAANPEPAFALSALMEIPEQYKTIVRLGYLNR